MKHQNTGKQPMTIAWAILGMVGVIVLGVLAFFMLRFAKGVDTLQDTNRKVEDLREGINDLEDETKAALADATKTNDTIDKLLKLAGYSRNELILASLGTDLFEILGNGIFGNWNPVPVEPITEDVSYLEITDINEFPKLLAETLIGAEPGGYYFVGYGRANYEMAMKCAEYVASTNKVNVWSVGSSVEDGSANARFEIEIWIEGNYDSDWDGDYDWDEDYDSDSDWEVETKPDSKYDFSDWEE